MTTAQMICLFFMLMIGVLSAPTIGIWDDMSRRKRVLLVAWLVFWLGPPLYFIWTKGVLG
jgi:hypothetical protein